MNANVLKSGATTALAIAGGFVAGKGWITADQWTQLSPLLLAIGVGVWKMFDHTDAAVTAKAEAVPGVTVVASVAATPSVRDAATKVSSHWLAPIFAGLMILPMLVGCVSGPNGKTVDPNVLAAVQAGAMIVCGVAPTAGAIAELYTKNDGVKTTETAIALACATLKPNSVVPAAIAPVTITPAATVTPAG